MFEYNSAINGGAAYNNKIINCIFNYNNATYGGAVYMGNISTDSRFKDNSAEEGNDAYNSSFFERIIINTFSDLNNVINSNNDNNIYLNTNYVYDFIHDYEFKEGIIINRSVTVYGNGYTIDGNNMARIFCVSEGNVVFCDVNFINGRTTGDGGAILGNCSVKNCTFVNNVATDGIHNLANYGGAICGNCSVTNCTFVNNFGRWGGAVSYCLVEDCIFENNSAWWGGAAFSSDFVNCRFNENYAEDEGGALRGCTATNCTFVSNSAYLSAGAMYYGSAKNCVFINNKAGSKGGCLSLAMAENCNFTNNTAQNGGASYQSEIINCNFTNNTARYNGGAIYGGSAINCIFNNNKAGNTGDNTYNVITPKLFLNTSNFSSIYNYGAKIIATLTTVKGIEITNVIITLRVYQNNDIINTYSLISGEYCMVNFDVGFYRLVFSVENQSYDVDSINATLTISKDTSKLTASAVTTAYNGGKYLVTNLKDSSGRPIKGVKITIKLSNGKTSTQITDKNGQVKFSTNGLAPKTYTATITFAGNTIYKQSTTTAKVTVKKATPKLTAAKKTFKKSVKTKKYTVTLKDNNGKAMKKVKLTLKIKGKTYKAKTNVKGKAVFKIKKLTKKGTFKAKVKFAGNTYYNAVTKTVKIKIK